MSEHESRTAEGADASLLARALDALPDPVFIKDAEHRWIYGNAAFGKLFGGKTPIGRSDADFFPPDQVEAFWDADDKVLRERRVLEQQEQVGEDLWALTKKWPVALKGDAPGLAGLICDVTSYRAESLEAERLRAADGARSDFLATMSHELRTPLNGVLGIAAILECELDAPRHREFCRLILSSGRQILAIVEDLLDLTRFASGKLVLECAAFSLAEAIRDTVELLRPMAEGKGLALSVAVDPALPLQVLGDAARVRQIATNLVANAIKYTPAGRVDVALLRSDPGARLVVADTGPGVPPDRRAAIFEAFTQVEAGPSRRHDGVGLGLAICRNLLSLMGGSIDVVETPGGGATFRAELPLAAAG